MPGMMPSLPEDDSPLVYSTDPERNRKCQKCGRLMPECRCQNAESLSAPSWRAVIRIETAGRGGKIVTVIDQLPRNESFLKDLSSELKKKCGSGGTYRIEPAGGLIEIQGDKRELVRLGLTKRGIAFKG